MQVARVTLAADFANGGPIRAVVEGFLEQAGSIAVGYDATLIVTDTINGKRYRLVECNDDA